MVTIPALIIRVPAEWPPTHEPFCGYIIRRLSMEVGYGEEQCGQSEKVAHGSRVQVCSEEGYHSLIPIQSRR